MDSVITFVITLMIWRQGERVVAKGRRGARCRRRCGVTAFLLGACSLAGCSRTRRKRLRDTFPRLSCCGGFNGRLARF